MNLPMDEMEDADFLAQYAEQDMEELILHWLSILGHHGPHHHRLELLHSLRIPSRDVPGAPDIRV